MLVTIISKEIRENLVSFRYILVTAVTLLLAALSVLVMFRDYQGRLERYEDLKPTLNSTALLLPPAPLSILVKGMDESICQQYSVSGTNVGAGGSEKAYNAIFRLFDTPDLLYITKIILSLCAMIISFRLVSEEKEARTLALTLSHSLGRPYLLLGKWLSGLAGLVVPFVLAVLGIAILLDLSPQVHLGYQDWLGLALFCLSSILYLTFFFSLGLLVSCLNVRSSSALAVSLFLWVLLVFVLPSLGGVSAAALSDLPSAESFSARNDLALLKRWAQQFQVDEGRGEIKDFTERDKVVADYRVRLDRQIELTRVITRVSPAAVYAFLATDFTGTGIYERLRLKKSLLNYQNLLKDNGPAGAGQAITYSRSTTGEVLSSTGLLNFLILLLQNAVVLAAAWVAFLRYDVR